MAHIVRVILFNATATLAILLALEAVSRWIRPIDSPDPLMTRHNDDWSQTRRYDPLLFWTMRPSIEGTTWRTNRLGLRGPEVLPKTPGEFRILSLGESTTFARRLDYEKSYSRRLELQLGSVEGRALRVINAGVPGYSLFQGVVYLRERGLALEPDAVLAYFGYNDFLPVAFREMRDAGSRHSTRGLTDRELFEQRSRPARRALEALLRFSNLARWIAFRNPPDPSAVSAAGGVRVPESDRRALLLELRSLCLEHDVRLAVVVPWYRRFEDHAPLLREVREWREVSLIDLPRILADPPKPRSVYFVDDLHPDAEGHQLIADAIERELRAKWGWSDPAPSG